MRARIEHTGGLNAEELETVKIWAAEAINYGDPDSYAADLRKHFLRWFVACGDAHVTLAKSIDSEPVLIAYVGKA